MSIKWTKQADKAISTHMARTIGRGADVHHEASSGAARAINRTTRLSVKADDVSRRWVFLRKNGWSELRQWGGDEERILVSSFSNTDIMPIEAGRIASESILETLGFYRTKGACLARSLLIGCRTQEDRVPFVPRGAQMTRDQIEAAIISGRASTSREVVDVCCISDTAANRHLAALVDAGKLDRWAQSGSNAMRYGAPGSAPDPRGAEDVTTVRSAVPQDMARRALRLALSTDNPDAKALATWAVGAANLSALDVLTEAMGAR